MQDSVEAKLRASVRAQEQRKSLRQREISRSQIISLIASGIVCCALAVGLYFYFADWEDSGGRRRMNAWVMLAYMALGKSGVSAALSLFGLGCLAVAFYRLSDAIADTGVLIQGFVAVALGVLFVGFGVFEYGLLDRLEAMGGLPVAHWLHGAMDNIFGKFGVLIFGLIGGLGLGAAGIYLLFSYRAQVVIK